MSQSVSHVGGNDWMEGKTSDEAALKEFTDYFCTNYPGPDTIISDPKWHAPKIFKAAKIAIRNQQERVAGCAAELREQMKAGKLRNDYHTRRRILTICEAVER
jgi:hypothetical protein